jgi:hypothetical protein
LEEDIGSKNIELSDGINQQMAWQEHRSIYESLQ